MAYSLPVAILAAASLTLMATPPCAAADTTLSFSRADLNNRETANRLLTEMERAARQECAEENRFGGAPRASMRACQTATLRVAVETVGSPCLASLYRARLDSDTELRCNQPQFAADQQAVPTQ